MKGIPVGVEGLGAVEDWEPGMRTVCLAGVCEIALIFIFWRDRSHLPTGEVTAFLL